MAESAQEYWQSMKLVRRSDEEGDETDEERSEMLRDLGYLQPGAAPTEITERDAPSQELLQRVEAAFREFSGAELPDMAIEARQSGEDGPWYLSARMELDATDGEPFWLMVALQDHVRLTVLRNSEGYPIHLAVTADGKPLFDKVLALD
jgi:hypothetical protein